jgi:hypothetical protein
MPKSKIMSAGTVGTNRRIRVNGPEGGGNKLQGLPPICNMRSPLVPYVRTRADGENRNVVFCINQLGGVGSKRSQFGSGNRAGVGQTGGCAKPTPPWWFNNQAIIAAVYLLNQFIQTATSNDAFLGFVGDHETVKGDYIYGAPGYDALSDTWAFEPFIGSSYYPNAGDDVKAAADLLNSMQIRAWVNGKYMIHDVGIIGTKIPDNTPKHGLNLSLADRFLIAVYGDTCASGTSGEATDGAACAGKVFPWWDFFPNCKECSVSGPPSGYCHFVKTDVNGWNACECAECT